MTLTDVLSLPGRHLKDRGAEKTTDRSGNFNYDLGDRHTSVHGSARAKSLSGWVFLAHATSARSATASRTPRQTATHKPFQQCQCPATGYQCWCLGSASVDLFPRKSIWTVPCLSFLHKCKLSCIFHTRASSDD